MAIYGATGLIPNNVQIFASTPNTFSWDNGSGSQTHYQLYIYKNSDNSLVYNSTKLASANEYHTVPSGTLTNNILYKWKVQTYQNTDTASSQWVIFKTASIPTFTLGTLPTNQQTYNFSALYNSSESIPIKWYRAYLTLSTSTEILLDSGILYPDTLVSSSATPLYAEFNGMESGTTYSIWFECENQLGYSLNTGVSNFTITYTYPTSISTLSLTPDNDNGTILLDWSALVYILGFVSGSTAYTTGKFNQGLQLNANSYLYFNTETFNDPFTAYCWVKLTSGYSGVIIKFGTSNADETGMQVFYNGTRFGFQHGSYTTVGRDASSLIGTWVLLGIKYGELIIKGTGFQEILTMT